MKHFKKAAFIGLAIFFPWIIMLIDDRPGVAFITLVLQVTLIGWPFATIWALGVVRSSLIPSEKKARGAV